MGGVVEEMAMNCLEEGCSIDTASDLSARNDQGKRYVQVMYLLGQLTALNKNPEANKSEIEKLVGAAARNFNVVEGFQFPGEPLGYTDKPYKGKVLLEY